MPEDIETLIGERLAHFFFPPQFTRCQRYVSTHQAQLASEILSRLGLVAQLEQRVVLTCRICILVMEPFEVLAGRWIDDLFPDLPAYVGVFVKDAVAGQTFVDAVEAVEETSYIGDASCES